MQPFIPRDGANKKEKSRNIKGSIRDNYEEPESDDENRKVSPGPGHYLTAAHDSSFRNRRAPQSLQFFGSNVKRFTDRPVGCELGPGQYKPRMTSKSNTVLKAAGSSSFKA